MFDQMTNLRCCFAELFQQRNKNGMPFFSPPCVNATAFICLGIQRVEPSTLFSNLFIQV